MDKYNYENIIVAMWSNTWQSNNNIGKKMCIEKGRQYYEENNKMLQKMTCDQCRGLIIWRRRKIMKNNTEETDIIISQKKTNTN